ncbi:hypothetical protein [Acinetobacter sp. YH01024]|uniref:hypothetical protein n=1 Tax=Acinetobacter sp. YH01024 TaxID=2601037 RepID=UPI0015D2759B|nr:hypothetical protein [Acinetobacter sp. YH01024]
MNAKEFIQKFGWNDARVCILNCACPEDRWFMRRGDLVSDQDFDDLKHLVESYELVEQFGGLEKAMDAVINQEANSRPMSQLAQAIADVESCMEVNDGST